MISLAFVVKKKNQEINALKETTTYILIPTSDCPAAGGDVPYVSKKKSALRGGTLKFFIFFMNLTQTYVFSYST